MTPIQMGARLYIPALGRFTSVDPIQGGTPNNYVYATDPVNEFDLDGNAIPWRGAAQIGIAASTGIGVLAACAVTVGSGCVLAAMAIGAAGGAGSNAVGQSGTGKRINRDAVILGGATGALEAGIGARGISSKNNFIRAGNGRVSFGPAPTKNSGTGKIGSKIPVHVHIEKAKAGINFIKKGKPQSKKLWGNWK